MIDHLPANLIFKNGFIYTADPTRRVAQALAVNAGRITYVGDDQGAMQYANPDTRVFDLQGRMLLPGFIDSHCHATSAVDEIYSVMLNKLSGVEAYLVATRAFLQAHPGITGLRGAGWLPPHFPPEGPSKTLLDGLAADIPAVIYSQDYHSAWVNSKALELAGIDRNTPDPPGGVIERLPDGNPSGTLRETAMDLVDGEGSEHPGVIPPYTVEQLVEGLRYFQKMAHSHGITMVHIPHLADVESDLEALRRMSGARELALRVVAGLHVKPDDDIGVVEKLVEVRQRAKEDPLLSPLVQIKSAKIFMDGVVEGSTAFLEEDYDHRPGFRGKPQWQAEQYQAMCVALHNAGFQIHVHAIGDAAVRMALDGVEAAQTRLNKGGQGFRHGITHLQLVRPQDIERFARLGVVAFPQPYWFVVDAFYEQALEYLGQGRADRQYPMRSFFERGVTVASASDYPVTISPRPLDAIESGVTRAVPGACEPVRRLNPAESVTLAQMLDSFTIHGAQAFFMENITGSLEVGKKADLIVLDRNPFEVEASEIHSTIVLMTLIDGRPVFAAQGDPDADDYNKIFNG